MICLGFKYHCCLRRSQILWLRCAATVKPLSLPRNFDAGPNAMRGCKSWGQRFGSWVLGSEESQKFLLFTFIRIRLGEWLNRCLDGKRVAKLFLPRSARKAASGCSGGSVSGRIRTIQTSECEAPLAHSRSTNVTKDTRLSRLGRRVW